MQKSSFSFRCIAACAVTMLFGLFGGLATPVRAQLPAGWTHTLLGSPTTGSATYSNGAFTVKGTETPVGQYGGGSFVYKQMTGDFDFKARLANFTTPSGSDMSANLLALNTPSTYNGQCSMLGRSFGPTQSPALDPNGGQAGGYDGPASNVVTWYRLTRFGNLFTSWKSADGQDWTPDNSGSWYAANSTLCVGFVVGNTDGVTLSTGVFDNVSLGALNLAYKTTWAGNTGGAPADFVGQTILGFAVSPSGVVYTDCPYEEGNRHNQVFSEVNGKPVRIDALQGVGGGFILATGPGYVYMALDAITRMELNADGSYPSSYPRYNDWNIPYPTGVIFDDIHGMVVKGDELYFSSTTTNKIYVYSITTKALLRSWSASSPGAMTIDGNGNLWVVRIAAGSGVQSNLFDGDQVQCWTPGSGSTAGTQLTARTISAAGVRPSSIFYDAPRGRLVIADDGAAQNIRAYTNLSGTPTLDTTFFNNGTFGANGGIYAGSTPGLVNDPASGGMARFNAPMGVSVDTAGNLYVGCRSQDWSNAGTDIRKFDSAGNYKWSLLGLIFTQDAAFDPTTDGQDLYSVRNHFTMDYSKTQGNEWSYKGFTLGQHNYNYVDNGGASTQYNGQGGTQMFVSGGQRFLVHGSVIYRFNGEVAVPAWEYFSEGTGRSYWSDSNADGRKTAGETTVLGTDFNILQSVTLQPNGDLWVTEYSNTTGGWIRKFTLTGIAANGVPAYNVSGSVNYTWPSQFDYLASAHYDAANDVMYLVGERAGVDFGDGSGWAESRAVFRYNSWSTGNRTPQYTLVLPYDATIGQAGAIKKVVAMRLDGQYIFALTGMEGYGGSGVYAYSKATGALVQRFVAGPEIGGRSGHIDNGCGLGVIKRSNGEYVMSLEDNGNNKIILYRWTPGGATPTPTPPPTPPPTPAVPTGLTATSGNGQVSLSWSASSGATSYILKRSTTSGGPYTNVVTQAGTTYTNTGLTNGTTYYYVVSATNSGGTSANSAQASATPAAATNPNLITNPSFDAQAANTQTPTGWTEWDTVAASYTEATGGSNSGARHATHYRSSAYTVYTSQTKTGLTNGLYTARIYARRSGNHIECFFDATDYGGADRTVNIPVASTYQLLEIKDINVTNGQCTVGIWSNANGGNWAYFDDVALIKQ